MEPAYSIADIARETGLTYQRAIDPALAERLWQLSQEMTGVTL